MQRVEAFTLDLLGVGWDKPQVTVLIKAAGGVTSQAVLDVEAAVEDWNTILGQINDAPQLLLVSGVKKADIITSDESRRWFDAGFRVAKDDYAIHL
jgi:hypothetical protein